ncbi:MAG TPA: cupin domain-containing protein [Acidimicrobiales bacterium]
MALRRVVTGRTADGTSVFVSDERIDAIAPRLMPGYEFHRVWGADAVPQLPQDGSPPPEDAYFPPPGGFRVGTFTVPPAGAAPAAGVDVAEGMAEVEALLPGLMAHMEPDNPGMHTTDTVDVEYVVSGRVVLELDDGATVELGPGDTLVQNGTRHAWRNPFDEPATLVVVLFGARPPA